MDGSCTFTTQCSGCGWIWMNSLGKIQLMEMRNLRMQKTALHFGSIAMCNGEYDLIFVMSEFWDGL